MEKDGGKIRMNADDKMIFQNFIIWTNVIFKKFVYIFF